MRLKTKSKMYSTARARLLDYFVSSNKAGLGRYPDNRNRKYKERNSFQIKC